MSIVEQSQNRTHSRLPELDSGSHSFSMVRLLRSFNLSLPTKSLSRNDARAFTLAEVLITLGIIGVVAAMTIPNLAKNIQDKQFKEAAKKAYSVASQAIQQMKTDNGGSLDSYYGATKTFKPDFIKYFKVIKDCGWENCVTSVAGVSDVYKTLEGSQYASSWRLDEGQFVTSDGMFWGIENFTGPIILITVDVNGYTQMPNVYGKDVFMFQILNDNLVPLGMVGTFYPISSNMCNKNFASATQGFACMYNVMQGIDY